MLKKENIDLKNQLNQTQQSSYQEEKKYLSTNRTIYANPLLTIGNDNNPCMLTLNPNAFERISKNSHKRVISEMLATNLKRKIKQNSDDITKSGVLKRIFKQKPNSFGGCSGKILQDKILNNIIREFRRDIIKNHEKTIHQPKLNLNVNKTLPNKHKSNNQLNNANNNSTTNNLQSSTNTIYSLLQNTSTNKKNFATNESIHIQTQPSNAYTVQNTIASNYINTTNNQSLSEKAEESSSMTQETILYKQSNFSITNSFSSHNNRSNNNNTNTNINLSISNSQVNSSLNLESSIGYQMSKKNMNNSNSNTAIKDDSLSRSSIIFQPHRDFKSSSNNLNNSSNSSSSKYLYNPIAVLKYHLDTVRDVYIEPNHKILTSVSEDKCLCFWDLEKFLKHYKDNPEPFITFRIHTTPIFTLTGPRKVNDQSMSVYSSGVDGVIRSVIIPDVKISNSEESLNKNTQLPWRAHQDMIWQLNYHPRCSLMSSVSSDGTVKIFKAYETDTSKHFYSYDSSSKNLVRNFMFRNHYFNFVEMPTSVAWDEINDNVLYVSHIASYIKIYDIETGESKGELSYKAEKNIPYESQQANRIIFHKENVIVTGHEDRQLRFFDVRSKEMIKNFVAHADSISCLSNGIGEFDLLTASHDGTVRCWDLRGGNNKLIFDIPAHRKKYDEGCLSLNVLRNENLMITSGADGIIKIFKI